MLAEGADFPAIMEWIVAYAGKPETTLSVTASAYAAHGEPDHPAIIRMLLHHITIRRDAAQLAGAPPLELLHDLGARLADHVALEEHEVFPLL